MKARCYIAGGMRGYPDFNFPEFDRVEILAKNLGFDVVSPAKMDRESPCPESMSSKERQYVYADRDIKEIFRCTHLIMLDGWEKSLGASTEFSLGRWLGLEILDQNFKPMNIAEYYYKKD